jgi:3-methyladenine DNA glycosylase AlkD
MTMKVIQDIKNKCAAHITMTSEAAKRFFKVSEGSYGQGEAFLGVTVPHLRKIARLYKDVELEVVRGLLQSSYNEERLLALLILVYQYQKCSIDRQEELCAFYLSNLNRINNWNLVDSSAYPILGYYLWARDRSILTKLARSTIVWERRIAIVATLYFIRKSDLDCTFMLAKLLLNDSHDPVHKSVGWMLREAGKKYQAQLISFLSDYPQQMPRIMLRYSMERLSDDQKKLINL